MKLSNKLGLRVEYYHKDFGVSNGSPDSNLYLIAAPPDFHLFGLLNQPVAEIRVSDADDPLRPFPGRAAGQNHLAPFGDKVMNLAARVGHDAAGMQVRHNTGMQLPRLLVRIGGTETDKALAALR